MSLSFVLYFLFPYSSDVFQFLPTSLPKHPSILEHWYSLTIAFPLTTMLLLLPGLAITLGPFFSAVGGTLRLKAGPHTASSVL
jgi:hypothetical protein